jgi:hypothetical protein
MMMRITPTRSPAQSERISDAAHWLAFVQTRLGIPSPIVRSVVARNFLDGMALDAGTSDAGRYFWFDDGSKLTISDDGEEVS